MSIQQGLRKGLGLAVTSVSMASIVLALAYLANGMLASSILSGDAVAQVARVTPNPTAWEGDHARFIAAMRLYHEGHYAAAFGQLTALADSGHAESARIVFAMLRFGPVLYRAQWSATPEQIDHWLALASLRQPTLVADGAD